jgi:type II secretory pathway pseudopilin PulG
VPVLPGRGFGPAPSLPLRRDQGWTLVEALVALSVLSLVLVLGIPRVERLASGVRTRLAAAEVAGALRLARMSAVRMERHVAVRFGWDGERSAGWFRLFVDGDGDGVRNRDIERRIDRPLGPKRDLRHLGRGVDFGIAAGLRPSDPSGSGRRLGRLTDPIRFNRSDLASFGPRGTSTPGSIYLSDQRGHLLVVRVFHRTGKVKTLRYDARTDRWRPQ